MGGCTVFIDGLRRRRRGPGWSLVTVTGDGVTVTDPQAWPPFKFKLVAACEPQQVDGLTRAGWRAGAPGSGCRGRRGGGIIMS